MENTNLSLFFNNLFELNNLWLKKEDILYIGNENWYFIYGKIALNSLIYKCFFGFSTTVEKVVRFFYRFAFDLNKLHNKL